MAKTLLLLGPADAGANTLVRALAGEHPDHCWHLVRLEPSDNGARTAPLRINAQDWKALWYLRYRRSEVAAVLPELVGRIIAESGDSRTVIAFEAPPDATLRHALAYDLRAFVLPPIRDPRVMFRSPEQGRRELQRILRDSATLTADLVGADEPDHADSDAAQHPLGPAPRTAVGELREAHVERFLACPLGTELAVRVHLQAPFSGLADADLIVLNTAAGAHQSESDLCWQKLLGLLSRLHRSAGHKPLAYACDLSDRDDPCFARILHYLGERLCRP